MDAAARGDSDWEEPPDVAAPSSLLSSAWSRDNRITSHPALSYTGKLVQVVSERSLQYVLQKSQKDLGPLQASSKRCGLYDWRVACESEAGPLTLRVPLALDEPGRRGRARLEIPRRTFEAIQHFRRGGLARFLPEARALITIDGRLPVAALGKHENYRYLALSRGSLQVQVGEGEHACWVPAGARATAEVLAEVLAALVYHYDPDADGGTAISEVAIGDGDFLVRRAASGSFEVKLAAARHREPGIDPQLLLSYLVQLVAYETWHALGEPIGIPVVASNPSVAFEGLLRGRRYRCRDLGLSEAQGTQTALDWIAAFGRSSHGRAYRPYVERFLAGNLPLQFGNDLRECWWRLLPLQQKFELAKLRARHDANPELLRSARALDEFLERLSREIGRSTSFAPGQVPFNDLDREGLGQLLTRAGVASDRRSALLDQLLAEWPYASFDQLLSCVPAAACLNDLRDRISFGHVILESQAGRLESLPPVQRPRAPRAWANPEVFSRVQLPATKSQAAVQTFPSFEHYMDGALHDPDWGYYGHAVQIGKRGHFYTHPELLSPHYGRWVARWAFKCWCELLDAGELSDSETFVLVEFGAGNGRLARDFMDAVKGPAPIAAAERWRVFAARLEYRIYERSDYLRQKQRSLLGPDARVDVGDARRPEQTLRRDFPEGLKGLVLTNEVPDAFGVHKVLFRRDGRALATLVVPRVEPRLLDALGQSLADAVADVDRRVRDSFQLRGNAGELYLDRHTYAQLMQALATLPIAERHARLAALWFEEAHVPASSIAELGSHLRAGAAEYATALAAEDSGVVLYVNLQGSAFIRGLAESLVSGYVMTIDYGGTTCGLVQGARRGDFRLRVYGDTERDDLPRPNDPYSFPGTQDMTSDVNFTELARAGRSAGLELIHYGAETDLSGDELGQLLGATSPDERELYDEFLGNPVFKVLMLGTRPSRIFDGCLASPEPLEHGEHSTSESKRSLWERIYESLTSE